MSEWLFIDLPSNTIAGLPEPQFPYPIRRENMALYEQLLPEEFPLHLVADELEVYLEEHPNRVERYRKEGTHLFLCAGIDAVMDACYEPSLHYFKLAIWLDADNLPARMNLAIALHHLKRGEEAIAQYREAMKRGSVWDWWQAWMLCADELMLMGRPAEAWPVLEEARAVVPDSHQFWELLAACEARLHPKCPQCGCDLHEQMRFCGSCGVRLEQAAATT